MARMIPAHCPMDAPPGEQAIFKALRDDPKSATWIVLHSLAISDHIRQVEGEADFVVIVPGRGVLVVEIKSHQSVERRDDGMWKLGRGDYASRGPFAQASEAMHSIRNFANKRLELGSTPFISAVWFTGVRAKTRLPSNPEWHSWQVLDSEDLASVPTAILQTLHEGNLHLSSKVRYAASHAVGPDLDTAEKLASILRPKFEIAISPGDRRRTRRSELTHFLTEQFQALDAASDNRVILFSGPAGSGKTFLALESLRRELSQGFSGRLFCFNRLLGRRLADEAADSKTQVGTLHQEMLRLAGLSQTPGGSGDDFWKVELPERAIAALMTVESEELADFLVVDEIQDLASQAYLDVLDLMVKGGLAQARLLLFGDFERQAIFEGPDGLQQIRDRVPHLAQFKLSTNCRNLPRIGYQVNHLSNFQPGYLHFRRSDDGVDPLFLPFASDTSRTELLKSAIGHLREEGFDLNEIAVLSPRKADSTAASTDDNWLRQVLRPATGLPPKLGEVHFSTVQAFKGLDSPAVILTDLDESIPATAFDSLFYIGLTRATDRLVVLFEPSVLRHALGGHR